jgi:catechol 2,3-dioxygenase-like lactoylglutathione lyase family enzyme
MEFVHTGLGASSEEKADRFFVGILGLEKSEPKTLDRKLSRALFGINDELLMLNYRGGSAHYEVFVHQGHETPRNQVAHSCLRVNDLAEIVEKCRAAGAKVVEVPKGSGVVTFLSDFDGNLFEMKEK